MSQEYVEIIVGFPLFKGYTSDGAEMLLDSGEVVDLSPGELLFSEGDPPSFVLLLLKGTLQVFVEREEKDLVLVDSKPGSILGELAVLCGIPRSASVRAIEPSVVLKFSAASFRSMLLRNTFLSERIFRSALQTLIDKEQSLIESLVQAEGVS